MIRRPSGLHLFSALAVAGLLASSASAATVTTQVSATASNILAPTSTQTGTLAANALFSYDTTTHALTVTLTDTQSPATLNGSELIGIFWNTSGTTFSGTFQSAMLGAGSIVIPAGGDVGAFGYTTTGSSSSQVVGSTGLSNYGVSAAGLGFSFNTIKLLGAAGTNGTNSDIDGLDGGLVGTGGAGANVPSNKPVIQNQIVYTFSNVSGINSSGSDITNLTNVTFMYGTAFGSTPPPPTVPLPAAAWMGSALLVGLAGLRQFRRRAMGA